MFTNMNKPKSSTNNQELVKDLVEGLYGKVATVSCNALEDGEREETLANYFAELDKTTQEETIVDNVIYENIPEIVKLIIKVAKEWDVAIQNQIHIKLGQLISGGVLEQVKKQLDADLKAECEDYPRKLEQAAKEAAEEYDSESDSKL